MSARLGGLIAALLGAGLGPCPVSAAPSNAPVVAWPPVAELSAKLRMELPSLPAPDASQTNAEAYAQSLAPWVLPETGTEAKPAGPDATSPVLKTFLYPGGSGYLRIGTVSPTITESVRSALAELGQGGPLSGLILDLRFASGTDFAAGIAGATPFASNGPVEFRLGDSVWRTQRDEKPPSVPVLILVNRQTRQAAEALASAVRASATKSIVLGSPTAGQARSYRPVAVSDSLTLQVATAALQLPDGSEFPASGLKPDLVVSVPEADERAYAIDEFRRVVQGRAMVQSGPGRLNEAELVRRRRGSRNSMEEFPSEADPHRRGSGRLARPDAGTPPSDASPRAVQDPALAVALDLISGFAAVAPETASPAASTGNSR